VSTQGHAGGGTGARGGRADLSNVVLLCRKRRPPLFAPGLGDLGGARGVVTFFFFATPTPINSDLDVDVDLAIPRDMDNDNDNDDDDDVNFVFVCTLPPDPLPLRAVDGDAFGLAINDDDDDEDDDNPPVALFVPVFFTFLPPVFFFLRPRFRGDGTTRAASTSTVSVFSAPIPASLISASDASSTPPSPRLVLSPRGRWCTVAVATLLPMLSKGVQRFINALLPLDMGNGFKISDPRGDRRGSLLFLLPLPAVSSPPSLPPPPVNTGGLVLLLEGDDAPWLRAASAAAASAAINAAV